MPTRILRDFTDSFRVARLSAHAERLYVRLIQKADDFGRFYADAPLLRSLCFPAHPDVREADIPRWLAECETAGLIVLFTSKGRKYLAIVEFKQRNRLKASKFPAAEGMPAEWEPSFDGQVDGQMTARGGDGGAFGGAGADGGANPPPPGAGAASPDCAGGDLSDSRPRNGSKVHQARKESVARQKRHKLAPSKSSAGGPVSGRVVYHPETTPLPIKLDTPAFRQVWGEWCAHRLEIKKKLTPTAVKNQLLSLAEMGEARASAAIRHSMANGWQGIFEPKGQAPTKGAAPELKVTDSFVGSDGQWNDRHTEGELDAIMNQPDVPAFPFVNTPKTPPSHGGEDAGL